MAGLCFFCLCPAIAQVKQDTSQLKTRTDTTLSKSNLGTVLANDSSTGKKAAADQVRLVTEGVISYRLEAEDVSSEEAHILSSASFTLSLKGSRVRTDFNSSLGNTATIYSSLTHAGALLQEYGQQKILVRMTREDFEDFGKAFKMAYTFTGDTTTIAGYRCKKAIGRTAAGDSLIVWYSPDLLPQNKEYNFRFGGLPGLPLRYENKMGDAKVVFEAFKVSLDPIPSSKFDIPKTGFREMTYAETKKL